MLILGGDTQKVANASSLYNARARSGMTAPSSLLPALLTEDSQPILLSLLWMGGVCVLGGGGGVGGDEWVMGRGVKSGGLQWANIKGLRSAFHQDPIYHGCSGWRGPAGGSVMYQPHCQFDSYLPSLHMSRY